MTRYLNRSTILYETVAHLLALPPQPRPSAIPYQPRQLPSPHASSLLAMPLYPLERYLRQPPNPQKHEPVFSMGCALFLIPNFIHPLYCVALAHSLPKTPGVGGAISLHFPCSAQLPWNEIVPPMYPPTPLECYSFAKMGVPTLGSLASTSATDQTRSLAKRVSAAASVSSFLQNVKRTCEAPSCASL